MKVFNKKKSFTNASLITRTFVRIFLIFTVLDLVVISGLVAYNSLKIREAQGTSLLASVQEAALNGNINWKEYELSDSASARMDYVRVTRASGIVDESHGTPAFLQGSTPRHRWGSFTLSGSDVFWYTSTTSHGTKAELWLNINVVIYSVIWTILAIILILLLTFIIAIFLMRRSARFISQPLSDLASMADENDGKALPVPENPVEVMKLTQSFNQLLGRLNQKIEQEQQFVSDASHELRTPVAAIRGHVSLLRRRWQEHPEIVEESLAYIDEESLRMKVLIEELLTISRGNHLEIKKQSFDLTAFVSHVVEEVQPALLQRISFESSNTFFITSDRNSIQRILIAFIENAGKYSAADSRIDVNLQEQGDCIDLSVTDEGVGIPDDEKDKVFERFYRVDKSRSSEVPGTGLGLAIAKQYAELNDAWIFVSDHLPHGSIFHLVLKKEK